MTATLFPPTMPPNASPFPAFQFDIIYADPPWSYNDKSSHRGGAARHYSTQSIEWIASLPVSQIAADDAVLFLWATWPTLPDAIAVIEAWGFTYKTCAFNWVKRNRNNQGWHVGMGAYTRDNPNGGSRSWKYVYGIPSPPSDSVPFVPNDMNLQVEMPTNGTNGIDFLGGGVAQREQQDPQVQAGGDPIPDEVMHGWLQ